MADAAIHVGRLVLHVEDFRREPTGIDGMERLIVNLSAKNPPGSPGSGERLPTVEVWDDDGGVADVQPDDNWVRLLAPTDETRSRLVFEVSEQAGELWLVFAPGTEDEVQVELIESAP